MITVQSTINASLSKVWEFWTTPEHIINWNNASPDWYTPKAINDFKVGGKINYTMAAKDGSVSFDFEGEYTNLVNHTLIQYRLADNRKVKITFQEVESGVVVTESFDAENENSEKMQNKVGNQYWIILKTIRNRFNLTL